MNVSFAIVDSSPSSKISKLLVFLLTYFGSVAVETVADVFS